jgi:dTDP-4-dehydrorhamnose 3,5-epimerase
MKIMKTALTGVLIVEPKVFEDPRGSFMETYHQARYVECGIEEVFVQDNYSHSIYGTLRGLHYQIRYPQAKLVQVLRGRIFDVVADIRQGSPSYGRWLSLELSDKNNRQVFIPKGFAHGFCVLSETADVWYKCSDFYRPENEGGILWSDPTLNIIYPIQEPLLSVKDSRYPVLDRIPADRLPVYTQKPGNRK